MKNITKKQWIKFSIVSILYILFSIWMQNGWLLFGLIVLVDIYLTKFIPWGAWKKSKNPKIQSALNWVDDIVFALVGVYLINLFFFQNYQIPSSSLERTLLTGDFLYVSKVSYGPRVPNTPISFPLVQNTLPFFNCKSYTEWPSWDYKRVKGFGNVKRNDIVVFNFPAGDTIALKRQNPDYYTLVAAYGRDAIRLNKQEYGEIMYRPVDKRENFVKRCIGMPGDSLEIRANQVFINGKIAEDPEMMQLNYTIYTTSAFSEAQIRALDITQDDLVNDDGSKNYIYHNNMWIYYLPLTKGNIEKMRKLSSVKDIVLDTNGDGYYYPVDYNTGWNRDNYGPIWIPRKGATIELNEFNLALYSRCIKNYENNSLEINNGTVYINGEAATNYTFKYDYYWMMGDNRHKSADSRSWGFVPEDHVVGKPIMVWLSLDKDRSIFNGGIRWNRLFSIVHAN
jgi:signal peptidase I, bacterial type